MPTDAQARLPKKAAKDTPAIRQYTVTLGLPESQQREADAGHKHIGRAPRKRRVCKRIGCGIQAVRGGDPDLCTAHRGGRRCQQEGCMKGERRVLGTLQTFALRTAAAGAASKTLTQSAVEMQTAPADVAAERTATRVVLDALVPGYGWGVSANQIAKPTRQRPCPCSS